MGNFKNGKETGTFTIGNRILISYNRKDTPCQYEINLKPIFDETAKFHKELKQKQKQIDRKNRKIICKIN